MSRRAKQSHVVDIDFLGAVIPPQLNYSDLNTASGAAAGDHYLLSLEATNEAQVAELNFNDLLGLDIDDLQYVDFWVELSANLAANAQLSVGVGSARNADARSVAQRAIFTVSGGSTALQVETDDGTTENEVLSSVNLTAGVVTRLRLDFKEGIQQIVGATSKAGKGSVRFYADNAQGQLTRIPTPGRHMDMSAYAGGLQPIVQLRKASGTSAETLKVHRIRFDFLKVG